jgi:hypothetical protein
VECAPVLDMVPRVSQGSYVILCYLSLASLISILRLLYISGREVSKVRMRGVRTWEVDWSSPKHAFENVCIFDEHSYRHLRPVTKLICSTFQLWRRITSLRALPMDAYWFSDVSLAPRRYWSVTSDIRLYSRMQNTSALFPTGGRPAIPFPYRILCDIQILLFVYYKK